MNFILSTDLHIPLHGQSNDATQVFPAFDFHSHSGHIDKKNVNNLSLDIKPINISMSHSELGSGKSAQSHEYKLKLILRYEVTRRSSTTHGTVINVLDFQSNEPCT